MIKQIMLMAGEHSGDIHGAHLAQALKKACPHCVLTGLGGQKMQAAGVDIIMDITTRHSIGFISNIAILLTNFPALKGLISRIKKIFKETPPSVLVLIDNQGLNMFFAGLAKKHSIKTVYYIPPQEWLWGTPRGGKKVVDTVDKIIAIFEKEYDFYRAFNASKVQYFGHPLLDIIPEKYLPRIRKEKLIGLFPGSRKTEIKKLTPILAEVADSLYAQDNSLKFMLSVSNPVYAGEIKSYFKNVKAPVEFVTDSNYVIISRSQMIIGASGTLSLECAILSTPMIVMYRISNLDYFLAKNLLKIKLDYISMPNIIAEEMVFPEFIQDGIKIDQIISTAQVMMHDKRFIEQFNLKVKAIRNSLGQRGVLAKVAESILESA